MVTKANLIKKPKGGGSSISDHSIDSPHFYVHRGTYGGVRCTLVSFRSRSASNLDFCFEGKVDFKDENEVFIQLLMNGVKISKILKSISENSFERGFDQGASETQHKIRKALGL